MRWTRSLPFVAAACLAIPWIAAQAQRSARSPRFVLTDREAFLFLDPEMVAPPTVTQAKWSPDGRYILAVREQRPPPPLTAPPPPGAVSLVLWNSSTHRSTEVWTRSTDTADVQGLAWLPSTGVCLVSVSMRPDPRANPAETHRTILRLEGSRTPVRLIPTLDGEQLLVSPTRPLAVLYDGAKATVRLMASNGDVGPLIPIPAMTNAEWAQDGSLLLRQWVPPAIRGQRPTFKWHALDAAAGVIRTLENAPPVYEATPERSPVSLKQTKQVLRAEETTQSVRPLWLESVEKSEQPRALVCADGEWGVLAPSGSAVLYAAQGTVWALPFLRLPKDPFLQARREALRKVAVSNAKQIGLGLLMYSQDYDEVLPPADAVTDRLQPYLKNEQIFNLPGTETPGFVYLQGGVPLSSIREPGKTQIGYLPGPGGRAVIYVDGHVEWQEEGARQ